MKRADRRAFVKTLANFPGLFFVAQSALQVAPRHVQAQGVTIDMTQSVGHVDVAPAFAQRGHQLHLVVVVFGQAGIGVISDRPGRHKLDGVGGFLEEKRRLPGRVAAHFSGVRSVVATNAIDAPNGENQVTARDGDGGGLHVERCFGAVGSHTRQGATGQGAQAQSGSGLKQ